MSSFHTLQRLQDKGDVQLYEELTNVLSRQKESGKLDSDWKEHKATIITFVIRDLSSDNDDLTQGCLRFLGYLIFDKGFAHFCDEEDVKSVIERLVDRVLTGTKHMTRLASWCLLV
eukprot:CAMPEP_0184366706 /NCGR_PEP_ID=MMETSP1089-20130417/155083_1 /TAXON_ID=38269 ORGANISM="Gloeochaete wittrockiana, Strain SAG46.84" /NCGR_SAMPLE_ID=MMETSP1089 /ASSEMBLY_ACC=CAM_ASM_000445 /LENGTH=115 /DNA_ID=CAMNT_0026708411 /DNA_START=10 /DNA_END=354 /DNA_ORIENTATION=+